MREYMAVAASRRLLFGSSLSRIHQKTSPLLLSSSISKTHLRNFSISNSSPLLLPTLLSKTTRLSSITPFSKPIFFNRYTTSSAAIDTSTDDIGCEATPISSHPWPEWVKFIGKLKSKGYIKSSILDEDGDSDTGAFVDGEVDGVVSRYTKKELDAWRNASLDFARERFDIFKSLSTEHIQAVVECGCPNLNRKPVNSAKRLRATLGLDEGDVCGACKLRDNCDRAYGILKDNEASARTVDIVRMLLVYALDPLVLYGGEKPDGREHIEVSARKLLSELSDLSETTPDPSLPKPAVKPPREKMMGGREGSQNFEMKRGDWICTYCDYMNFSRNLHCLECKAEGPKGVQVNNVEMKRGDWNCPNCDFMNFSRNLRCLKCKTEGPKKVFVDDVEMKKGDWNCTQCQFMNFARNTECIRCKTRRPKRELLPGEWECPSCDFLNYRRNTVCLKCNCDKPRDQVSEYEEQIWRKPPQQYR